MSDACGADSEGGSEPPEEVLLVAVCAGARCRALREMHDPTAAEAGPSGALLRAAVRGRPNAVLVSTQCLGPCHRACVVAVGRGVAGDGGRLLWTERPVGLGLVELDGRAHELAEWVGDTAPDIAGLPQELWGIGAA